MKVEIGARQNLLASIEDGVLLKHVEPGERPPTPRPKKQKQPKQHPGGGPPPPPPKKGKYFYLHF